MSTKTDAVQDWVVTIRVAIGDDSPFKGMIDLTEIFNLPLPMQQEIYDALTEQERDQLKAVYG